MKNPRFIKIVSLSLLIGLFAGLTPHLPTVRAQTEPGETNPLNVTETPGSESRIPTEIKPGSENAIPIPEEPPGDPNPLQSLPDSAPLAPTPTIFKTIPEPTQTPPDIQSASQPEISQDEPDPTCHSITVQVDPPNPGLVTISPLPNCNSTQYAQGTPLTISAEPASGFTGWSGDFNGEQNPLTITVNSDINLTAHFTQINPPHVEKIDTLPQTSNKKLDENEIASVAIQSFFIFFDKEMLDKPGHTEIDDITYPGNYSLIHLGADFIAGSEDDQEYEISSVTYSAIDRKATVLVNHSTGLAAGKYQLRLNGDESIQDLAGNKLDGDSDGLGGDDFIRTFFININPAVPFPNNPQPNACCNNPLPEFSWSIAPNATRYQIQIDNDKKFKTPEINLILEEETTSFTPDSPLTPGRYFWRVRGLNLFGISGKWSTAPSFQLDTTPPSEPLPQKPIHGFSTNDTTPAFTWEKVKDAKYYRLQIADNMEFDTPLINILTHLTTYTISDTASLDYGLYFWRIQAEDPAGNTSNWSKSRSLVITFMKSPIHEAHVDQPAPTVEWYPVSNAKAYQIQVSTDEQFIEILQFERSIPAPNTSVILERFSTGIYFWRMCALTDPTSECESWQQPMKFTISPAPGIPTLIYPANKQILNDSTPELTWEQVLHGELPEPHHYEIQVDKSTKFLAPLAAGTTSAGVTSFIPTSMDDGSYFWRVRAINYLGHAGAWSSTQSFQMDTHVPAAPVLINPKINSYTTDSTPKFSWRSSSGASSYAFELSNDQFMSSLKESVIKRTAYTLPVEDALDYGRYQWRVAARDLAGNQSPWKTIDSFDVTFQRAPLNNAFTGEMPAFKWSKVAGAQHYRLQISNELSFDTTLLDDMNIAGNAVSYPSISLSIGQYYWRMQVQILGSWSVWTPAWTFTITPQPGIPSLISPSPAAIINALPEFNWQEVPQGDLPMPHAYQIQVSRSASFSSSAIVIDITTLSGIAQFTPVQLSDGVYFWRCRAINGLGQAGRWSIIHKFTLDTNSPLPPMLLTPAASSRTGDSTPVFKWKPSSGAAQYQFQLSQTSSFDEMDINQSVKKNVLSISNANQLAFGTYFWRVKAIDAAGNESGWSATQNFEINFMKYPSQGAYLLTQTPYLSWGKISGAQAYHLQVDDAADFVNPIVDINHVPSSSTKQMVRLDFGAYFWRMKVQTAAGWGEWMPVGEFFITPPVSAPFLLTPLDKASTTDRTPTFSWISSTTNGLPGMNNYELQISTNQAFATVQQNCDTAAGQTTCTMTQLPPGNYYWRVRSINPLGYASAWSAKRNLLIQ